MRTPLIPRDKVQAGLEWILLFGFALFAVMSVLPASGKTLNNIAYGFVLLPSLILVLGWQSNLTLLLVRSPPLLLFLLAVLASDLIEVRTDFLKAVAYIFLLCAGAMILAKRKSRELIWMYLVFSLAAVAMLLIAIHGWLSVFLEHGVFVRQAGAGAASNPIYAGLLSVAGLVFIWIVFLEDWTAKRAIKAYFHAAAFISFIVLAVVVFEARSALVGFAVFILFYSLKYNNLKWIWAICLLVGCFVISFGLDGAILVRGMSYRPEIWVDAVRQFYFGCNLFAGCGKTEEFFVGQYWGAHSGYVGTLYRHGVVGMMGLIIFAAWFFVNGWRAGGRWFLVSLVGWGGMVSSMDGFVGSPHAWWIFVWIPTVAAINEFYEKTNSQGVMQDDISKRD